METRIEKISLETLGAVERERERERACFTNSYVNCLLKQANFSDAQKYENGINKFNRDSEKSIKFLCCFLLSFFDMLRNNYNNLILSRQGVRTNIVKALRILKIRVLQK